MIFSCGGFSFGTHTMKKFYFLLIVLLLLPGIHYAEELNSISTNHVTVLFDDGLDKAADAAGRRYPAIKESLQKIIGWEIDFKPTLYLVKNHDRFLQMSGHPLVIGFAVPRENLIVIDYSKVLLNPSSFSSLLKHELCHLLLHRYITKSNFPKWLDEGISQWAGDGFADIAIEDYSRVDRAIVTGRQIPFRYLSNTFPADNEALMLAYAQSKSLVEYIVNEHGPDTVHALLTSLKNGNNIDSAVYSSLFISFDELEKNWYSAMNKKGTWLILLINHLYEVLFLFGALSLTAAYIKITFRKRAERKLEDSREEESEDCH